MDGYQFILWITTSLGVIWLGTIALLVWKQK